LRLIFVSILGLAVASCGGVDAPVAPEDMPWTAQLHEISAAPSCYVPPPVIPLPEGVSDALIRQSESYDKNATSRAEACVERYSEVVAVITADPEAGQWRIQRDTPEGPLDMWITAKNVHAHAGRFMVDFVRVAGEGCAKGLKDGGVAFGTFTRQRTTIDVVGMSLTWNDRAIMTATPTPIGPLAALYRGCDPKANISFGSVLRYDAAPFISCWNNRGEFVSCDSVDTETLGW
jgi:hypothetical protein